MPTRKPIIFIEDDAQDAETIGSALQELGVKNEVKYFSNADEAYQYLLTTADRPLIIFCDVKMGRQDGLSFRRHMLDEPQLLRKAIPFVFLSGLTSNTIITEAYKLDIQGFFEKPGTYRELKEYLITVIAYWQRARRPE